MGKMEKRTELKIRNLKIGPTFNQARTMKGHMRWWHERKSWLIIMRSQYKKIRFEMKEAMREKMEEKFDVGKNY